MRGGGVGQGALRGKVDLCNDGLTDICVKNANFMPYFYS